MVDLSLKVSADLISPAKFVDYNDKVVSLIGTLSKEDAVIVRRGNEVTGILDKRSLGREMSGVTISKNAIAGKMARKTPILSGDSTLMDAIRYMHASRSKALPYVENGRVKGILNRSALLKSILSAKALKGFRVESAMTPNPLAIHNSRNISEAASIMEKNKVNRLVTFTENGIPTVITLHDILLQGRKTNDRKPQRTMRKVSPNDAAVVELATKNPVYINPESGLDEAVRAFVMNNISSLIVKKKNGSEALGVITVYDVFESIIMAEQKPTNVLITGFDEETEDYRDDIEQDTARFLERIGKINKIKVDYLSIRFKKIRDKKYEVYVRASVPKHGVMYLRTTGFYLERTIDNSLNKLKGMVIKARGKSVIKGEQGEPAGEEED